jgi:hypothetical protein
MDTLKPQPQGSWSPSVTLNTILLTIRLLMAHPNADDGLEPGITEEYRRDRAAYMRNAARHTAAHASAVPAAASAGRLVDLPTPLSQSTTSNTSVSQSCSSSGMPITTSAMGTIVRKEKDAGNVKPGTSAGTLAGSVFKEETTVEAAASTAFTINSTCQVSTTEKESKNRNDVIASKRKRTVHMLNDHELGFSCLEDDQRGSEDVAFTLNLHQCCEEDLSCTDEGLDVEELQCHGGAFTLLGCNPGCEHLMHSRVNYVQVSDADVLEHVDAGTGTERGGSRNETSLKYLESPPKRIRK